MRNKKSHRARRAFALTFSLILLGFGLFFGMAVVYVNTYNRLSPERIELLDFDYAVFEDAITVELAGKRFDVPVPRKEPQLSDAAVSFVPAWARLCGGAAKKVADAAMRQLERLCNGGM